MTQPKKDPNIYVHPEAFAALDDDEKGKFLAEFSQALLPGGVDKLLAESRQLSDTPNDGNCPECHMALVVQKDWDDELECPNTSCTLFGKVSFIGCDLSELIQQRMDDFERE